MKAKGASLSQKHPKKERNDASVINRPLIDIDPTQSTHGITLPLSYRYCLRMLAIKYDEV
jgi:hypothetical protein